MELIFQCWGVGPEKVVAALDQRMEKYIHNYASVKVGFTPDPKIAYSNHKSDPEQWNWMVVKYESIEPSFKKQIKNMIGRKDEHFIKSDKEKSDEENQYLYVLLKE